jgi:predicted GNAT family acetyltransferase
MHDEAEHRYEIRVDGEPAGFAVYEPHGSVLAFTHTEIDPRFQGRRLVGEALDDVRRLELRVLPFCPYVRAFIARHPDYIDLVPEGRRGPFGLAALG